MEYLPLVGGAFGVTGWLISVIWLWRMLATGKLHTDREFQNEKAASVRLENFYATERAEDKATIKILTEAVAAYGKAAERTEPVLEVVTKTMQAVQQRAELMNEGEHRG
jgi:hypothetical protein